MGDFDLPELNRGPLGPRIKVSVDWRHCDNKLGKKDKNYYIK